MTDALEAAELAFEDGELEQALSHAERGLTEAPDDVQALELKGHLLAELGRFEEADEVFTALLARTPKNLPALIAAADVKIRDPSDDGSQVEAGLALLERAAPLARNTVWRNGCSSASVICTRWSFTSSGRE